MNKIQLFNRDGGNLWLEQVKDNIWKLKVDDKHKWIFEHIRIIGDYPNNIEAVDPPGGPMLGLGSLLSDKKHNEYKINKITDTLTFEIVKWEQ